MRIEALKNGFVIFDNDDEVLQVKVEKIEGINIFPPDRHANDWRVQVSGYGYIVFHVPTREEALDLQNKITLVLNQAYKVSN